MQGKYKVLIVDDSMANLMGLQNILEKEGYEVITAVHGEKALKVLSSEKIDVVLLDLMMPGLSGFDVLGEMSNLNILNSVPVIIVSARSTSKDVKQALERGAVDYIKKPIDIIELLARISSAIKHGRNQIYIDKIEKLLHQAAADNLKETVSVVQKFINENKDNLKTSKELTEKLKDRLIFNLDNTSALCEFLNDFFNIELDK